MIKRRTGLLSPVGVIMQSEQGRLKFARVPEFDGTVISTGSKVMRLVRIVVQSSHTRTVDLIQGK